MKLSKPTTTTTSLATQRLTGVDERRTRHFKADPLNDSGRDKGVALAKLPKYKLLDANNSRDLVEYGDRIKLRKAQDKDELVFLESTEEADSLLVSHLDGDDSNFIHGDKDLRDIRQATIVELEDQKKSRTSLSSPPLPVYLYSLADSQAQLSADELIQYNSLLSEIHKEAIESYQKHDPENRNTSDYIERIRRVLRQSQREIQGDRAQKSLAEARQSLATKLRKQKRVNASLALTILALALSFDRSDNPKALIEEIEAAQAAKISTDQELQAIRGNSIYDHDFSFSPDALNLLEKRLTKPDSLERLETELSGTKFEFQAIKALFNAVKDKLKKEARIDQKTLDNAILTIPQVHQPRPNNFDVFLHNGQLNIFFPLDPLRAAVTEIREGKEKPLKDEAGAIVDRILAF